MSARILLVDDDENDVFLMKRALRRAGVVAPIQIAWDGRQAVDYFKGEGRFGDRNEYPLPDVVLLDLKLPQILGLEVLRWLRDQEQFNSTIVLALSASRAPDDIRGAYRNGADAYFVKPSHLDQLDSLARTIRDSWLNAPRPCSETPGFTGEFGSRPDLLDGPNPRHLTWSLAHS